MKEVDLDIREIQGPIFHELLLVPSFLLLIRIRSLMHLKIRLNTYGKTHALVIKDTSFTVFIILHRQCFEALLKTGINGILKMSENFRQHRLKTGHGTEITELLLQLRLLFYRWH